MALPIIIYFKVTDILTQDMLRKSRHPQTIIPHCMVPSRYCQASLHNDIQNSFY